MSNDEKKNLEYKLHFSSVSLTHFKLIFYLIFLLPVSYVCNIKVGKKTWFKNLSWALVEMIGTIYHKQKFWQYFTNLLFAIVLS